MSDANHLVPYPDALPLPRVSLGPQARVASSSLLVAGTVEVDPTFAEQLASTHAQWFEVGLVDTPHGRAEFTRDVPNVSDEALAHLDERGLVRVGTAVTPGMFLVGRVVPRDAVQLSPEEKLLRAIFGEKVGDVVDASLRVPGGCVGVVEVAERKGDVAHVKVSWSRALEVGDVLEVGGQQLVVTALRALDGADLAWRGPAGPQRVKKLVIARDLLEVSVRTANAFARLGLVTLGDLCRMTESELLESEGFGRQSLKEVKDLLATLSLSLRSGERVGERGRTSSE